MDRLTLAEVAVILDPDEGGEVWGWMDVEAYMRRWQAMTPLERLEAMEG